MTPLSRMTDFFRRHPLMIMLCYLPVYLIAFFTLEQVVTPRYILHSPLDDLIPFCEYFILPYALWFVELAAVPLLLLRFDRQAYYYQCFVMLVGMTLCLVTYAVLPNGLDLRVEITGQNIFADLVRLMQQVDTPTNVCPSIHVASALAMCLALLRCRGLGERRWVRLTAWTACLAIVLSTVFLKQHSVIDVFWGVVLTAALHLLYLYLFVPAQAAVPEQERELEELKG
ncbi:MAG: phosphatase PAP2 family protein [Clostridiales bacterium]|nr:phosphatase PAP2 family protein [Clostridiales bacterium]